MTRHATWGSAPARLTDEASRALDARRFGALHAGARSPGHILDDADELERNGRHHEARHERRDAAAVLWAQLRHTSLRPSGVSRAQSRRWIASVCAA